MLLGVALAGEVVTAYEWSAAGVAVAGTALLLLDSRAPRPADPDRGLRPAP